MHLKVYSLNDDSVIAASFSEGRLILVAWSTRQILADVRLPSNCGSCFDVSGDGRSVITGYEREPGSVVEIRRFEEAEVTYRCSATSVIDTALSHDGAVFIYKTLRDLVAGCINKTEMLCLTDGAAPSNGCYLRTPNTFLIPSRHQRMVYRILASDMSVENVNVKSRQPLWWLRAAPVERPIIVVSANLVTAFHDMAPGRVPAMAWKRRIQGLHRACFSGDGTLLGLLIETADKRYVDVLESTSGATLHRFAGSDCGAFPLTGSTVMLASGKTLDLASGERTDGVSQASWWRALGL